MPNKIYMRHKGRSRWIGPFTVSDVIRSDIWKAWLKAKLPLRELVQLHENGWFHIIFDKLRKITEENNRSVQIVEAETTIYGNFFFCVNHEWMVAKCRMLGLPRPTYPSLCEFMECKVLTKPYERINVLGDGNCWFRSVSIWISGTEDNHLAIRSALMRAYRENRLINRMVGDVDAHLAEKRVHRPGAWATEIELMTTAMMLDVDIHVYTTKDNKNFKWNLFGKAGNFKKGTTTRDRCLYIEHVNMNHFVVVKSVLPE